MTAAASVYDLIIIGAGPAGLTAALYAGRSLLKTLLLEKMVCGGRILMSGHIENYPGFPGGISTHDLASRMTEQVRELHVDIVPEEAVQIQPDEKKVATSENKTYAAGALILATGSYPRTLNVPGEEAFTGRGVSYCAVCDAPFYKDKQVIIVGGGNSVAEEALYLARFARTVTIVHRRGEMRAAAILQERLRKEPKIQFLPGSVVTEIKGTAKVEAVIIKDAACGAGCREPASGRAVSCDGVFIYIGYEPDTALVKNKIRMDEAGFIITDDAMHTSEAGVFACGDCRKKTLYQVVNACGDGAVAADSAFKYISTL